MLKNTNYIIPAIFLLLFINCLIVIQPVSAETVQSLEPIIPGANAELVQSGGNGTDAFTFCNISSVKYPNSSIIIQDVEMEQRLGDFNYTLLASNYSNVIGNYIVSGYCGVGNDITFWAYNLPITQSGQDSINGGEGLIIIGSLLTMIIIGSLLLFVAFKFEGLVGRIFFISLSVLVFTMAILYGTVAVQQVLGGFDNIIAGFETFWFVIKILLSLGFLIFLVIIILILIKLWRLKRTGFD